MTAGTTHERMATGEAPPRGSDRAFAIVFAAVFAVVALWPLIVADGPVRLWAAVLASIFAAGAIFRPALFAPLNAVWTRVGLLLHRVVNPLVMGVIFFGVVTPIGVYKRWRGDDLLRLRRDPAATTYWIARRPPGPEPRSMERMF